VQAYKLPTVTLLPRKAQHALSMQPFDQEHLPLALDRRAKGCILPSRALIGQRSAYVAHESRIGSAAGSEVGACHSQAQRAVGAAAHHICVRIILSIIEPPADGAELKRSRSGQRPASAAEAAHIRNLHTALDDRCRAELRKIVVKIL
jgi:hypothetical protein